MKNVISIASATFSETLRQKLLLLICLAALLLVLSSNYLLRLDLGNERLRFVFDFGSGAAEFFGAIVAIVATAQIFHSEIDNKTITTLMSKPVSFAQFCSGKIMGSAAALGAFVLVIILATAAMLMYTQYELSQNPRGMLGQTPCNYAGLIVFGILQWGKLCAIASITAAVCSFSRSLLFSVVVSFMILAICVMGTTTIALGGEQTILMKITSNIFPDFQIFKISENFAFAPIDWKAAVSLAAYSAVYCACCCALSAWTFSRREF